jgi:hypothetical protein
MLVKLLVRRKLGLLQLIPTYFCAANAAAGAKDKMVAGAKAVGETAANIGEGVVSAGKAAGETVGKP